MASGEVFADALVAGPFAARGSHPVMLTPPGELHAEVEENLRLLGIEHVVLMGGTAAVSDAVEQSIENLGLEVTRLAGATRYDTAVKAAELVAGRYSDAAGDMCFTNERIGLARARVPFDSFSAGPLLGRLCAPLLLADPAAVPPDTAAFLDASRAAGATAGATALELSVFGGDAAVSQAALDAYLSGEGAGVAKTEAGDSDTPGVLPAGTCGGSIEDEPRPLLDSDRAEDPSWSPDCRQIVYSDRGSLWIMDNDGTNLGRVTALRRGLLARSFLVPRRHADRLHPWPPQRRWQLVLSHLRGQRGRHRQDQAVEWRCRGFQGVLLARREPHSL